MFNVEFPPSSVCWLVVIIGLLVALYQYRKKLFSGKETWIRVLVAAVIMVSWGVYMISYTASSSPEVSLWFMKGFFHSTPSIWPSLIVVVVIVLVWLNPDSDVPSGVLLIIPPMAVAVTLIHVDCQDFLIWMTVMGGFPFVGIKIPDKKVYKITIMILLLQIFDATTIPIACPRLTPIVEWVLMCLFGIWFVNLCKEKDYEIGDNVDDELGRVLSAIPPLAAFGTVLAFLLINKPFVGILYGCIMIVLLVEGMVKIEDSQKKKA